MSEVKIICPTHGRAGKVSTLRHVPDAILCVAESQEPEYREYYPDAEYDVHPDDLVGLAPKRNWIADRHPDVFMVDDDITSVRDLTAAPGDRLYIPPDLVRPHIERAALMAEDLGTYLYTFNPVADARVYGPISPFRFTGYAAGHAFGLRAGHGLWWHPQCMQEDWWISLLNAYYHRTVVVDERVGFFQVGTFKGRGGLGAHRTREVEREGFDLLRKHFGAVVQHKQGTRTHSASHPHQPRVKLPF